MVKSADYNHIIYPGIYKINGSSFTYSPKISTIIIYLLHQESHILVLINKHGFR